MLAIVESQLREQLCSSLSFEITHQQEMRSCLKTRLRNKCKFKGAQFQRERSFRACKSYGSENP